MSVPTLDPATHSGDLKDALVKHVRGMGIGGKVQLADGVAVRAMRSRAGGGRSSRIFMATGQGVTDQSTHRTAHDAATAALDMSARSSHPASVGGKRQYPDYATYAQRNATKS